MLLETQHPHNKQLTVAVLGKPNAGKSTLINNLIGFDLAIVSDKPQTTRNQFQCIFTIDHTEIVLVDTPGIHKSAQELNKRMNHQVEMGADGADLNLVLLDMADKPELAFKELLESIQFQLGPTWILFTKADLNFNVDTEAIYARIKELSPAVQKKFIISAKDGTNIHELTGALCDAAQPGPHLFPDGSASNKNERFFVTEYIREQAFRILKEELPYEIAVVVDEYKDIKDKDAEAPISAHVSASILVNRPSQRAIVVGRGGSIIKEIGTGARKKIEAMVGGKVHLNLHVKVSPKWFSNNWVLDELGLPRSQTSARVWRSK
ncbi:MAG: GTPase Era [Bacteriovoracaceae bacterium]|nr:GTPase Era [Bacteriovoracaceae bacterium]